MLQTSFKINNASSTSNSLFESKILLTSSLAPTPPGSEGLASMPAYGSQYQVVCVPNPTGGYTQVQISSGPHHPSAGLNANPCAPQKEGRSRLETAKFHFCASNNFSLDRTRRLQSVHISPATRHDGRGFGQYLRPLWHRHLGQGLHRSGH